LFRANAALICLGGFVVVWVLGYLLSHNLDDQLRYAAFGLELAGIVVVAYGLYGTLRLFDRPSQSSRFRAWVRSFPRLHPPALEVRGSAAFGGLATAGTGTLRATAPAMASAEDRLRILEGELDRVDQRITQFRIDVRTQFAAVLQSIDSESRTRQTDLSKLSARLEAFSVGGVDYEVIGLVWLVLGLALANLTPELAENLPDVGFLMHRPTADNLP
jgi:hypothetical protein